MSDRKQPTSLRKRLRGSRRDFLAQSLRSAAGVGAAGMTLSAHPLRAAAQESRMNGASAPSQLKITDLKTLSTAGPNRNGWNWIFVKIETNQGLHGIGEASLQYKDAAVIAELDSFKNYLIGKDPLRIEQIWNDLHRGVTWTGGPVTLSAISGIDLALWDIKGKAFGVPVCDLGGGRVRDSMKLYANGWFRGARGPDGLARAAAAAVKQGYSALKLYPFGGVQSATPERLERGAKQVETVREAVGPHVEIGVDVRCALNIWSARRAAQLLEPYNIAWMEEPLLYDNAAALAEFARSVRVPVATGERLYTRWEFRELLENNAVGIVQPDICHAGGLSELRKIATAAETYYVTIAPHNSNGPISTIASIHLDMSVPNALMQEVVINMIPRYNEVLTEPLRIKDGNAVPYDGPGWGVDLREDVLAKYPPDEYTQIESEGSRYY